MELEHLKANKNADTTLEFELRAEGLDINQGKVCFLIKNGESDHSIPCKHNMDKTWSVVIPERISKELNDCDYIVQVMAEDFYFEPVAGTIKFIDKDNITATFGELARKQNVQQPKKEELVKSNKPPKLKVSTEEPKIEPLQHSTQPIAEPQNVELDKDIQQPAPSPTNVEDLANKIISQQKKTSENFNFNKNDAAKQVLEQQRQLKEAKLKEQQDIEEFNQKKRDWEINEQARLRREKNAKVKQALQDLKN